MIQTFLSYTFRDLNLETKNVYLKKFPVNFYLISLYKCVNSKNILYEAMFYFNLYSVQKCIYPLKRINSGQQKVK